jgi:hypothetical protein
MDGPFSANADAMAARTVDRSRAVLDYFLPDIPELSCEFPQRYGQYLDSTLRVLDACVLSRSIAHVHTFERSFDPSGNMVALGLMGS